MRKFTIWLTIRVGYATVQENINECEDRSQHEQINIVQTDNGSFNH